jgi:hypothetical protein
LQPSAPSRHHPTYGSRERARALPHSSSRSIADGNKTRSAGLDYCHRAPPAARERSLHVQIRGVLRRPGTRTLPKNTLMGYRSSNHTGRQSARPVRTGRRLLVCLRRTGGSISLAPCSNWCRYRSRTHIGIKKPSRGPLPEHGQTLTLCFGLPHITMSLSRASNFQRAGLTKP